MTHLDSLTKMNVELEGLLHVLKNRDSLEARSALSQKFEEYSALMKEYLAAQTAPAPAVQEQIQDTVAEAQYMEVKDQEAQEAEDIPEDDLAVSAIEKGDSEFEKEYSEPDYTVMEKEDKDLHSILHPNLLQAFTLNDRFRFTRMLFNGDSEDFTETVNLLAQLPNKEDAHDYLINDLMMDPADEVVKEFLSFIDAHMN